MIFLGLGLPVAFPCCADRLSLHGPARRPNGDAVRPSHGWTRAASAGSRDRIRQDDDRRLKTFGAMHGHHPYFVAIALFQIALHFRFFGPNPVQKALKRGC